MTGRKVITRTIALVMMREICKLLVIATASSWQLWSVEGKWEERKSSLKVQTGSVSTIMLKMMLPTMLLMMVTMMLLVCSALQATPLECPAEIVRLSKCYKLCGLLGT